MSFYVESGGRVRDRSRELLPRQKSRTNIHKKPHKTPGPSLCKVPKLFIFSLSGLRKKRKALDIRFTFRYN